MLEAGDLARVGEPVPRTLRTVALMLEVTGFHADAGDHIIEIAAVEVTGRANAGRFHALIDPLQTVPSSMTAIHGIATADVEGRRVFADIATEFLSFIAGARLVMHNAPFDLLFLESEFEESSMQPIRACVAEVVDTLAMASHHWPTEGNSLVAICDRLGVTVDTGEHGAMLDALALSTVYLRLLAMERH